MENLDQQLTALFQDASFAEKAKNFKTVEDMKIALEAHGIEITDTNWNSIAKIYIRQHKNYLQREAYKRKSKKS